MDKQQVQRLEGKELLDKVEQMEDVPVKEKARACGYVTATAQGERIDTRGWYEAVAKAFAEEKNIALDPQHDRQFSYVATVQKNGSLLVGYSYLKMMGIKPGQQYKIELQDGDILLKLIRDN